MKWLDKFKFTVSVLVVILLMEIVFNDEKYRPSSVDYYLTAIAAGILIWPFVLYFFAREALKGIRVKL